MKNWSRQKVLGYLLAIFAAGAAAGASLGYAARHHPSFPPPREMAATIRSHLVSRLGLSPNQVEKIEPLVEQACAELEGAQEESRQRITAAFQKMHAQIAAHLTPEQQRKLEEWDQERAQRARMCSPHHSPHPPNP